MLRQKLKKLSVLLDISVPVETEPGVFQTRLTHPKLKGELSFVHSAEVGRDEILKALDENVIGHMFDLVKTVGELVNGKPKEPTAASATTSSAGKS